MSAAAGGKFTSAVWPSSRKTPPRLDGSAPKTEIVYGPPTRSPEKSYWPVARVVVVNFVPVGSCNTVTVAPAIGEPCFVRTTPLIADVVIPCPSTLLTNVRARAINPPSARLVMEDSFMVCSLVWWCRRCRRHHGESQLERRENRSQGLACRDFRATHGCNHSNNAS